MAFNVFFAQFPVAEAQAEGHLERGCGKIGRAEINSVFNPLAYSVLFGVDSFNNERVARGRNGVLNRDVSAYAGLVITETQVFGFNPNRKTGVFVFTKAQRRGRREFLGGAGEFIGCVVFGGYVRNHKNFAAFHGQLVLVGILRLFIENEIFRFLFNVIIVKSAGVVIVFAVFGKLGFFSGFFVFVGFGFRVDNSRVAVGAYSRRRIFRIPRKRPAYRRRYGELGIGGKGRKLEIAVRHQLGIGGIHDRFFRARRGGRRLIVTRGGKRQREAQQYGENENRKSFKVELGCCFHISPFLRFV